MFAGVLLLDGFKEMLDWKKESFIYIELYIIDQGIIKCNE